MQKAKPVRNPKLLAKVRSLPCVVCLRVGGVDAHHVKTRKTGGPDEGWNLMPLCHDHHMEWHRIGSITFCQRHSRVRTWMELTGWEQNPVSLHWFHSKAP